MPRYIVADWLILMTTLLVIVMLLLLEYVAMRRAARASVRRVMRPLWIGAWICAGVTAACAAIDSVPYYINGTIWPRSMILAMAVIKSACIFGVMVWFLINAKPMMQAARELDRSIE